MAKSERKHTTYSDELAEEICAAIRTSSSGIRKLRKENPHWPNVQTIFEWRVRYPSFGESYARAKVDQIDVLVDEIIEISDDDSRDTIIKTDNKGHEYEACNNEWLQRSRLRVDTRKWLAAKLKPKTYGEQKEPEDTNKNDFINQNRKEIESK